MKKHTPLRIALSKRGISLTDVVSKGIPLGTAASHYYGYREMTVPYVQKYAETFGILVEELVPTATPTNTTESGEDGSHA